MTRYPRPLIFAFLVSFARLVAAPVVAVVAVPTVLMAASTPVATPMPSPSTTSASATGTAATASEARIRAVPPGATVTAAYVRLNNPSASTLTITGAHSAAADKVELHRHVHSGAGMKMEKLQRVEIPAGTQISFEPMGLHLMLIGLHAGAIGASKTTVPITLEFQGGATLDLSAVVKSPDEIQ